MSVVCYAQPADSPNVARPSVLPDCMSYKYAYTVTILYPGLEPKTFDVGSDISRLHNSLLISFYYEDLQIVQIPRLHRTQYKMQDHS